MDSSEPEVLSALEGTHPVLVFVHASDWPDMPEVWDETRDVYTGNVRMMRIDVGTAPNLEMAYGVKYLPTFLSNRGSCVGYRTRVQLEHMLLGLE